METTDEDSKKRSALPDPVSIIVAEDSILPRNFGLHN